MLCDHFNGIFSPLILLIIRLSFHYYLGLHSSAATLQKEARLKIACAAPSQIPLYDDFGRPSGKTPPYSLGDSFTFDNKNNVSMLHVDTSFITDHELENNDFVGTNESVTGPIAGPDQIPVTPNLKLIKIKHNLTSSQTPKVRFVLYVNE